MKLVALETMTDEAITEVLEASGKGKPPVYRKPLREVLAHVGNAQGVLPVDWKEINPTADKRQTVISGLKSALKKDSENGQHFARIVGVRAGTDDAKILLVIRAGEQDATEQDETETQ
jgi:hypothetical protein